MQPLTEIGQGLRRQLVDAPSAGSLVGNKSGFSQHLQVLRHRRPAQRELIAERTCGLWLLGEYLQKPAAHRTRQRREDVICCGHDNHDMSEITDMSTISDTSGRGDSRVWNYSGLVPVMITL